ncbi:MAG: hypothetical protein HYU58_00700 [Proteobacteria bacterium]|nr:hypothetical protein [Pseudomonadota bacterium]
MFIIKRAVLATALLLAACTNGVPGDFHTTGKRIAILSFAGHQLNALENVKPDQKTLAAAFEKYHSAKAMWESTVTDKDFEISPMRTWKHDISDWGMDAFFVSKAATILESTHEIVPFEWDPADYAEQGTYGFWTDKEKEEVGEIVRRQKGFAAANDIDAYVVILPGTRELTAWDRQSFGVGLTRSFYIESFKDDLPMVDKFYVHALYYIAIIDGRTLKFIAGQPTLEEDLFEDRFRGSPGKTVDAAYWAANYADISPEQKTKIEALLRELISSSMPAALKHLGMAP